VPAIPLAPNVVQTTHFPQERHHSTRRTDSSLSGSPGGCERSGCEPRVPSPLQVIGLDRHIAIREYKLPVDAFSVLAEPTRLRILEELRASESSVGNLVARLSVSQPTMSKHLKVLREAGFVSCRPAAQQRIYRIESGPLEAIDRWLAPYRRLWTERLDALERHLDSQEER
jgi:DNA-binding transcriptional ArsR family regulator